MFQLTDIKDAHSKVKSGADFPNYVQDLIKLGVKKYETYAKAAQDEMQAKEKALMDPIEKRVTDAINAAAAKKGVKYVLPAGVLVYKAGGYDLLNDVKKELGL